MTPNKTIVTAATNGGFIHEIETATQNQVSNDRLSSNQSIAAVEADSLKHCDEIANVITNESIQKKSVDLNELIDEAPSNITNTKNDAPIAMKVIIKSPPPPQQDQTKTMTVVEYKPSHRGWHLDQSKLNDISSVDDVRHTIIECREPNGTTYFIEADQCIVAESRATITNASSLDSMAGNGDGGDTANALHQSYELSELEKIQLEKNIMDRVLNQTDIEPDPVVSHTTSATASVAIVAAAATNDDPASDDSATEDEEREVRAIVHASNSRFNSPIFTPPPTPSTPPSSLPLTPHTQFQPFEKRAQTLRMPNFQIGAYEEMPTHKLLYENDQSRRAFKLRLERLFSQTDEIRSPTKTANVQCVSSAVVTKHSQRLLPSITKLNHSMSAPESLVVPIDDRRPPELEVKQTEMLRTTTTTANHTVAEIPSAPAFNQRLYDTMGRRYRKVFSSTGDVVDIDDNESKIPTSKSAPHTLQKSVLQRAKAHENLTQLDGAGDGIMKTNKIDAEHNGNGDDDDADADDGYAPTNIASIRHKLESIFSKGHNIQADVYDLDHNQNENVRRNKRHELFDTVRMQKMRFSNVLKAIESISSEMHANLHSTNTTAGNNILHEIKRRESMTDVHSQPPMEQCDRHKINGIGHETTTTALVAVAAQAKSIERNANEHNH